MWRPGRTRWIAYFVVACIGIGACTSDQTTSAGGQTNWLRCRQDESCPTQLQCACGFCAPPCEETAQCGDSGEGASCQATQELPAACLLDPMTVPMAARVCIRSCVLDVDCEDGKSDFVCREGTCIPADVLDSPISAAPNVSDVEVLLTVDNAYAFGYGTQTDLRHHFGDHTSWLAEDILGCETGPESYTVAVGGLQAGDYLYIVAWADASTSQGVVGQFSSNQQTIYTGDARWKVCATGVNYDPGTGGPSVDEINRQLVLCNQGDTDPATTSRGWVDEVGNGVGALAVGEDNRTGRQVATLGNEFALACAVDADAKWMWFNWDPGVIAWPQQTPFLWPSGATGVDNPDKQFLIFRLGVAEIFL